MLAQVSRASFYRWLHAKQPGEENVEVRAAIHEIALAHRRRYGYRRVTAELRSRGFAVNHKRVVRLMGDDNLLSLRRRKFVATTQSGHDLEVYWNAAASIRPTSVDQLWVADITYIRLRDEFVYVAVILDACSRLVVGWAIERSLHTRLTIAALAQAITARQPAPGLIHHSDRGVQYASHEYVEKLLAYGIVPSMSRPGNPYDNAKCESFMKTLKQEEIYCNEYAGLDELRASVGDFIENYYNRLRLHSALGYRTPEAADAAARADSSHPQHTAAPKMSFLRHEEIYQSDV